MIKHQIMTSLEAGRLASATIEGKPAATRSVLGRAAQDQAQQDGRDNEAAQSPLHEPAR